MTSYSARRSYVPELGVIDPDRRNIGVFVNRKILGGHC